MPIRGIGTDLCRVIRIKKSLEQYGERFEKKIFTDEERKYCNQRREPEIHFAGRFAVKESIYKALGTGISMGVRWKEVEVIRSPGGPPRCHLSGRAEELAKSQEADSIYITITHDGDFAMAVAILEGQ